MQTDSNPLAELAEIEDLPALYEAATRLYHQHNDIANAAARVRAIAITQLHTGGAGSLDTIGKRFGMSREAVHALVRKGRKHLGQGLEQTIQLFAGDAPPALTRPVDVATAAYQLNTATAAEVDQQLARLEEELHALRAGLRTS